MQLLFMKSNYFFILILNIISLLADQLWYLKEFALANHKMETKANSEHALEERLFERLAAPYRKLRNKFFWPSDFPLIAKTYRLFQHLKLTLLLDEFLYFYIRPA